MIWPDMDILAGNLSYAASVEGAFSFVIIGNARRPWEHGNAKALGVRDTLGPFSLGTGE